MTHAEYRIARGSSAYDISIVGCFSESEETRRGAMLGFIGFRVVHGGFVSPPVRCSCREDRMVRGGVYVHRPKRLVSFWRHEDRCAHRSETIGLRLVMEG